MLAAKAVSDTKFLQEYTTFTPGWQARLHELENEFAASQAACGQVFDACKAKVDALKNAPEDAAAKPPAAADSGSIEQQSSDE